MTAQKCIAHYDLDAFFVSVERLKNPSLQGKPLLVGGSTQRGVVSACSYEARKFGVHSAMPMHQAILLCPEAIVVKGSMDAYSYYSQWVTNIIRQEMPLVQKASIDEFYIDMSGMDTFFGCFKYARRLRQLIIQETGLPVSFAIAPNKIVSKIATNECKPNGEMQVLPGTEESFLSPLSIHKIPMVGQKTASALIAKGVENISDIFNLSENVLTDLLGKNGLSLLNRLKGSEEEPIKAFRKKKSISCENTFYNNTNDQSFLQNELVRLVEKVSHKLREENMQAGCVGIKIKYADFKVFIHQCQIEPTAHDHIIMKAVKQLFHQLYIKGQMARLIGVRLSNLNTNYQTRLFTIDTTHNNLYKELDNMRSKYGHTIINRASAVIAYEQDHARPENVMWFNRNA